MSGKAIYTHPVRNEYQNKGSKNNLRLVSHYCTPGLNSFVDNNIINHEEAVDYYSLPDNFTLPSPCIESLPIESENDVVLDIIHSKNQWKTDNEKFIKICKEKLDFDYLKTLKNNLNENKNIQSVGIPYVFTRYCSNLMRDPDKYFDSITNWYFKNTLDKCNINGKSYLACARGSNLDSLEIVSIEDKKNIKVVAKENFNGPILDVKALKPQELLVRQKTKLFYLWNNSDTELCLKSKLIYDCNNIPLGDSDGLSNCYCSVDVEHIIKIWKDQNCIQDKYFERENINQNDSFLHLGFLYNQTDIVGMIDRQKFYLIDTRTDVSKPCTVYVPNRLLDKCEEFNTLCCSNLNDHSFYATTNHSMLTLDKRMGFVHKISHMLTAPPSLITTHYFENSLEPNELVIVGNQSDENLVKLPNILFQNDHLVCQTLASSIPKPLDSLYEIRHKGHCLDPKLTKRCSRPIIGVTGIGETVDDLQLFSINSVGDLFVQAFDKTEDSVELDKIIISNFENLLTNKSQMVKKLNYTHLTDMSKLFDLEPPEHNKEDIECSGGFWKMSKEEMLSYSDHVAPLILHPWDLDDVSEWETENENNDDLNNDDDDLGNNYVVKVNSWFEKNKLSTTEPCLENKNNPPNNKPKSQNDLRQSTDTDSSSSGYSVLINSEDEFNIENENLPSAILKLKL
ncbi:uncharacterized protein LOC126846308 [Adelges cooleyi]|uniref:uncharacterized protein LOC126846308 n=1 Tax=Adelges cooleyi TaxID=133065 RepID=UPI00218086AD|nr:uncharacterized protein LOC126846308 [Adelges cooleyi]